MARDRILQIYRGTTAQNDAFTGAQGELTMDTARKEIRIHDGSTAGGNVVGLTPGFIAPFAGSTAPAGWLVCDGSAVSRTTYAKLFAVIGTTYGAGDGNSSFNIPNLMGRVPFCMWGEYIGLSTNGVLPNISGQIDFLKSSSTNGGASCSGVFSGSYTKSGGQYTGTSNYSSFVLDFNASLSNSIYGNGWYGGQRVIPSSIGMMYVIKY